MEAFNLQSDFCILPFRGKMAISRECPQEITQLIKDGYGVLGGGGEEVEQAGLLGKGRGRGGNQWRTVLVPPAPFGNKSPPFAKGLRARRKNESPCLRLNFFRGLALC